MNRFWTADQHLESFESIDYFKRPHKDLDHMHKAIVTNHNMRVKNAHKQTIDGKEINVPCDTVVCVGDYFVKSPGKHPRDYFEKFNGKSIFIEGNHDSNNGLKCDAKYMFTNIGKYRVFVSHYPTFNQVNEVINKRTWDFLRRNIREMADFVICGHVHDKWHYAKDDYSGIINVNVGVDVNRFMPIKDQEVVEIYLKAFKHFNGEKTNE